MLKKHFRGRMTIRAGTIVSPAQVELAYQAKAAYIISSSVSEVVVRKTKELGMLSIPGALSPSGVLDVHEYDADYVKLLPAARMTASYVKDLMGPTSHMKLIATTGIAEENTTEFAAVGCTGHGTSGRLVGKYAIQEDRLEELQHRAEAFIACLRKGEG